MDELTSKITELLQDPEGMEKIKTMAEGLMGNSQNAEPDILQSSENPLGDIDVGAVMRAISLFKNSGNDNRSNLLLALKPHLSTDRQPRVDKAIKILRLVSLIPVFREQGILNL